jgi:hypothetical protein
MSRIIAEHTIFVAGTTAFSQIDLALQEPEVGKNGLHGCTYSIAIGRMLDGNTIYGTSSLHALLLAMETATEMINYYLSVAGAEELEPENGIMTYLNELFSGADLGETAT